MKKMILAAAAAAVCVSLGACSLFEKNVRTETQLPSDRHTVETGNVPKPYRSQDLERGELGGDWTIEKVLGKEAKGQETPFLKFDPNEHRVYGSNGCNTVNATYANNAADSTLTFTNMLTTMRLCPGEGLSETQINQAMNMTARYTWELKDGCYYIQLFDAQMQPLMTLARQDFDFLNGTWQVTGIDGNAVNNEDMQLVFDVAEMKIHGNTGCNVLNGSIVTDMAERGSISFQGMATTRMMCPNINEETALLVALESATKIHPVDKNKVEMLDAHGTVVLTLARTN
ncbi:MAG: META domain-containing protein [Bacteroidales bacterium]|nr:META domain-containing protein [Bacteroidales bacterium]